MLLVLALLASADPVAVTPAAAKPAEEKRICRREVGTGTIISKRICRTKAEWEAISRADEQNTDRFNSEKGSRGGLTGSDQ